MLKKIAPQNLSQLCKLQKNFKHELVVLCHETCSVFSFLRLVKSLMFS